MFTGSDSFAAATLGGNLHRDVRRALLIPNAATRPSLLVAMHETLASRGVEVIEKPWEAYGQPDNVRAVEELDSSGLAMVLLDQRRTVANRLDKRRGYMRRKRALQRVVIDVVPYEVLPWRAFFPFAFFDRSLLGYHHSYALEQDYERYLDGALSENPCAAERLVERTRHSAFVDSARFFMRRPKVATIGASPQHHDDYARVRGELFERETSILAVKRKLAAWIQERYPARDVPLDLKRVYKADFKRLVHTDLPFDRWLADEIKSLMDHTDLMFELYAESGR